MKKNDIDKWRPIIQRWIRRWRPKLYLQDWSIYLEFGASDNRSSFYAATTSFDTTYHRATITVLPEFFTHDQGSRERYILHELLHIALADLTHVAEQRWRTEAELISALETTVERFVKSIGDLETTPRSPDEVS